VALGDTAGWQPALLFRGQPNEIRRSGNQP
jgi:hypothetical protein